MTPLFEICLIGGILVTGAGVVVILKRCCNRDHGEMAEAMRRAEGTLLRDEVQEKILLQRYNECRARMGKECCVHPEYEFNEKHRIVPGRDK